MKYTIVIIDDNEDHSLVAQRILYSAGFRTVPVYRGEDALKAMKENPPHLVLLDIMMPGMSGFEVFNAMKEVESLRSVPVVMLSSLNTKEQVRTAIGMGASDYVLKPINSKVLVQKVQSALHANKKKDISVLIDFRDKVGRGGVVVTGKMVCIGEKRVRVNSDLFPGKDSSLFVDSEILRDAGLEKGKLKTLRSRKIEGEHKFSSEFIFESIGDDGHTKLKKWIEKLEGNKDQ